MVYILQTYKHNLITVGQKLWPGRKILNKAKVNSSQNIHQNTTETQKNITPRLRICMAKHLCANKDNFLLVLTKPREIRMSWPKEKPSLSF